MSIVPDFTLYRYTPSRFGDKFILQRKLIGDEYYVPIYRAGGYSVLAVKTEEEAQQLLTELSNQGLHRGY